MAETTAVVIRIGYVAANAIPAKPTVRTAMPSTISGLAPKRSARAPLKGVKPC